MSLSPKQSGHTSLGDVLALSKNPTFSRYLKYLSGPESLIVESAKEPHLASPKDLVFVSTTDHLQAALDQNAGIIVALEKLKPESIQRTDGMGLFSTPAIPAAMALILPLFDRKSSRFHQGIHPSAAVDTSAHIGKNVSIGPFAVIGANAIVEDNCLIGAHVVIESGAKIGEKSILHPHVFIGAYCQLGQSCEIHPHTTIGSDGFGYVEGHDKRRHKIPQLGIVVLEDFVEMGASCTVDRATIGETRIGEGTKFDNLCHVAHNCKIGKHNAFAQGFGVAGSTEIGDHVTVGGHTQITDHVRVGSNITIGGKSGVTKDLLEPGIYAGYPLEPVRDAMKSIANITKITELRKQLAQVRKHLNLKDEN